MTTCVTTCVGPGSGSTRLANAFVVCTSQLNSESLPLVRRKGVVKPAPVMASDCGG